MKDVHVDKAGSREVCSNGGHAVQVLVNALEGCVGSISFIYKYNYT